MNRLVDGWRNRSARGTLVFSYRSGQNQTSAMLDGDYARTQDAWAISGYSAQREARGLLTLLEPGDTIEAILELRLSGSNPNEGETLCLPAYS